MIMCYCVASGSQINEEKTIIISLQQNQTSLSSLKNINILKHGDKFKYLGSMFKIGYELHAAWRHEQEDNLVNKLRRRSHALAKYATTLFGRVSIWNVMLLSLLWHHGYTINLLNIEKRINIIEKQFLWKGGRCRIHRLFLQKKLQLQCGLNLLSLRNQYTKQIKQWMVDLYENKQQNCMMITRQLYERHSKLFF